MAGAEPDRARAHLWGLRAAVLLAFVATLWGFGPRAGQVLAARFRAADRDSPAVALDRVGFVSLPQWLHGPVLVAVARDLSPWLEGDVPILDDAGAASLRQDLASVAWVRRVQLQRAFPDRFRLALELRRPALLVKGPAGELLCCVDRDGTALPPVALPGLTATFLRPEGGRPPADWRLGQPFPDARVRAALAVALEWQEQVVPLVPGCPELLEVDANNLGERWIVGPRHPEIRVGLRRLDGASVVFAYDRAPDAPRPRVPAATKADVLRNILAERPGLSGLTGGDLRLLVRWRDWLLPRTGTDPAGPWSDAARDPSDPESTGPR